MSKIPRISYVVEGTTDFIVLDALVEQFLEAVDYIPTLIQPPISAYANHQGPLGGGWKGVLKWCEDEGNVLGGLTESITIANCDCLIVHVDADIANDADLALLNLSTPCPPPSDTCNRIRDYLVTLLGTNLPPKIVLCVPAQCIKAWIFCSLYPADVPTYLPIECRTEVEKLLIGKLERLVRDKDGRARKQPDKYKKSVTKIANGWSNAVQYCEEAKRFEEECRTALP